MQLTPPISFSSKNQCIIDTLHNVIHLKIKFINSIHELGQSWKSFFLGKRVKSFGDLQATLQSLLSNDLRFCNSRWGFLVFPWVNVEVGWATLIFCLRGLESFTSQIHYQASSVSKLIIANFVRLPEAAFHNAT